MNYMDAPQPECFKIMTSDEQRRLMNGEDVSVDGVTYRLRSLSDIRDENILKIRKVKEDGDKLKELLGGDQSTSTSSLDGIDMRSISFGFLMGTIVSFLLITIMYGSDEESFPLLILVFVASLFYGKYR